MIIVDPPSINEMLGSGKFLDQCEPRRRFLSLNWVSGLVDPRSIAHDAFEIRSLDLIDLIDLAHQNRLSSRSKVGQIADQNAEQQ
jgi:hypothetical protein